MKVGPEFRVGVCCIPQMESVELFEVGTQFITRPRPFQVLQAQLCSLKRMTPRFLILLQARLGYERKGELEQC